MENVDTLCWRQVPWAGRRAFVLNGKIVAIAGAAGGLGPTVARSFFDAGASLAIAGRNAAGMARLLESLSVPEERGMATEADLADAAAARRWARQIGERFGRIDVVAHLVGGYKSGTSIEEIDPADWSALSDMLVRTTLNVASAFAGLLSKGGGGRFIAVTSPKAQAPTAKSALYSMAKAASDALVLALADQFRGTGATANLIMVDSIDFPETRGTYPKKPYGKSTPAEEIAAAMLFLCSEQAATINGVRLPLTGKG
jgi:NAD(P)-dependent dehydrogenase (short-subunit alcohol dehydrogenase family)